MGVIVAVPDGSRKTFKAESPIGSVLSRLEKLYGVGDLLDSQGDSVLEDILPAGSYVYEVPIAPVTQAAPVACTHIPLSSELEALLDKFLREEFTLRTLDNGVPLCGRRPSLLLHRLREQPTQAFEQFLGRATRFSMVVGTSGAGKTRTLYAYMSRTFGLLFVANNMGNGGSADFLSLVEDVARRFTRPGDHDRNAEVVTFAVRLLLLTRLEIYFYCLKRGVTPDRWLLIQACSQHMEHVSGERPGNLDIFNLHWQANLQANRSIFFQSQVQFGYEIGQVDKLIEELLVREQAEIPPIFLDEAQTITLLDPAQGDYRSSVPAEGGVYAARPLAKPVLQGFFKAGRLEHRLIFCGTGFTLYFQRDELASSANKPIVEDDMFTEFGDWSDATQMVNYARGILQVDERVEKIITDDIYPWFYGRFRPFAVLLEEVLVRGDHISRVWRDVVHLMTTSRETIAAVSKTYYELVKGLCTSNGAMRNRLRGILLQATVQYFYYGRCYALAFGKGSIEAEILERGVGRIRGCDGVVIDEPLPLVAMHNYFQSVGDLQCALYSGLGNYASSQGLHWQHVMPLEIQRWWEAENGVMARMALFEDLQLTETLENLKEETSEIVEGSIWDNKPLVVVYLADSQYTSIDYICDSSPRCKFFVAENRSGTDIMWRVKFASGVVVLFSAQLKLPKSIGAKNVDAQNKAAPNSLITKEWKSSVMVFLIVYPSSRGKLPQVTRSELAGGRTKCTVVVDKSNADKMISRDHLNNLDLLKTDKFSENDLPSDACRVCGQVDDNGVAAQATHVQSFRCCSSECS